MRDLTSEAGDVLALRGHRELPTADLIPVAWRDHADCHVFNPAVIRDGDGMLAFYRVVHADLGRRIAACRLDARGTPIAGTARAFSDDIPAVDPWHADPRVYLLRGRSFLYWNTGYPEQGDNQQFLIEFDRASLMPVGRPMEMILDGKRQRIEKNWILFEDDGDVYAIYSIAPHRVLRASQWLNDRIVFVDAYKTWWNSARILQKFGPPRGGAQPISRGAFRYHFCHASSGYPSGSYYVAQCYEFERDRPYRMTRFTPEPIDLPNPRGGRFDLPKLNKRVESVVYPAGNVALENDRLMISYGVNDEAAFLATIPFADIDRRLTPVRAQGALRWRVHDTLSAIVRRVRARLLP